MRRDVVPGREEAGERLLLDRLDLPAQRGERATAELAQHVDVAVLARHALGTELADDETLVALERGERAGDALGWCSEAIRDIGGEERSVRAGVPADDLLERARHRVGERHRQAERQRAAEGVAIASGVLGGGESSLAAECDLDHPSFGEQHFQPPTVLPGPVPARTVASQLDLVGGEITDLAEHVVQLVGGARPPSVGDALQLQLDVGEHLGVEQLAQFLGTEQVAQEIPVEGQRGRPALGRAGHRLRTCTRRSS